MERNLTNEIVSIIQSDLSNEAIKSALEMYHDKDIADSFASLTGEELEKLYHILDKQRMSDIFSYLDDPEIYINEMNHEQVADLIELMDADDAVDILDELPEEDRANIIDLLDEEAGEDIKLIASYEEGTIGSMMTTNFISVPHTYTIAKTMKHVIEEAPINDNIFTIFALNEDGTYHGSIDLKALIIARKDDELEKIIKTTYPVLYAHETIEDKIQEIRDYALNILPVLNEKNELVGVITSDDLVDAVEEQISEDYAKLAGLSSEEDIVEPTLTSVKKRMPWLIILLLFDVLISMLISGFEKVIIVLPMLVFFQSLILDMAGNVGTQSLGVAIRVLSEEELNRKLALRLLFKELKIGFANGLILSVTAFAVVFLFSLITKSTIIIGEAYSIILALKASGVVSLALFIALIVSSLVGSLMPIIFIKLKVDPAVASGPFITTINDVVSVFVYYGLAIFMFNAFM